MADYPLDMQLVVDPLNPENVVRGGAIYFYDPADVAGTNPIAIKDPSGLPLPNPLTSNDYGFIQPTIVTIPKVKWKSGTFEGFFFSYDGLRNEAVAAKVAAEAAGSTAGAAATADIAARVAAGQFKGPAGTNGLNGVNGSNVLPTQEAIEQAIINPGPAKTALNATIVDAIVSSAGAGSPRPAYPVADWAHWGDSMTAGDSTGWVAKLSGKTGLNHYNGGIGGQTSIQVMARQGGKTSTVATATIPGTGGVTVVPTPNPVRDGSQYDRAGAIAGVEGILAQRGSVVTFTRTYAGLPVAVPAGSAFVPREGALYRDRTATLWAGRNNYSWSDQTIVADIQRMLNYLTPEFKRVLVFEMPPMNTETNGTPARATLDAVNAQIKAAFPQYWLDVMTWLRTTAAANAAGITFTAADNTAISAGVTPPSFTSDGLHLNALGNTALAEYVYQTARARGMVAAPAIPTPPVALEALYLPATWNQAALSWEDGTGKGHTLTADTAAKAPTPTTEAGASFLRFNGAKVVKNAAFALPQPFTVYALAKVAGYPASGRAVLVSMNPTTNMFLPSINTSGSVLPRVDAVEITTKTAVDAGWHAHGAVVNGATSLGIFDTTEVAAVWGTIGGTVMGVGSSNGDYSVPYFNGDIAAIAIAPAALNSTDRAALLAYLKAQTGVA